MPVAKVSQDPAPAADDTVAKVSQSPPSDPVDAVEISTTASTTDSAADSASDDEKKTRSRQATTDAKGAEILQQGRTKSDVTAHEELRLPRTMQMAISMRQRQAAEVDQTTRLGAFGDAIRMQRAPVPFVVDEKRLHSLRRQLEWFFSDANLATDHALYRNISNALPEGWLCCSYLTNCRRIRELCTSPALIPMALQASHLQTMIKPCEEDLRSGHRSERSIFVRRNQPLPPLLMADCRTESGELPSNPEKHVVSDANQTLNRLKDQCRVQARLKLTEVGNSKTVFREQVEGIPSTDGPVLAVGYERVLYGDGGAYVEVREDQIQWQAWPHYFSKRYLGAYYDEFYTLQSHRRWAYNWNSWCKKPSEGVLMLYAQVKPVSDRPWAPGAGSARPHAGRSTGYADYRAGYYYFSADELLITAEMPKENEYEV